MEDFKVIHSIEVTRFEIQIEAHCARLEYEIAENSMTIHHTFVPPELRGKGLAAKLAEAALDYAEATGLTVVSRCSYIDRYLERRQ